MLRNYLHAESDLCIKDNDHVSKGHISLDTPSTRREDESRGYHCSSNSDWRSHSRGRFAAVGKDTWIVPRWRVQRWDKETQRFLEAIFLPTKRQSITSNPDFFPRISFCFPVVYLEEGRSIRMGAASRPRYGRVSGVGRVARQWWCRRP